MPRKRTGRKWCNSSRPQCETVRSLANGPGEWVCWGRSTHSAFTRCLQRLLSLFCVWEEPVGGAQPPLISIMTLWLWTTGTSSQLFLPVCNLFMYLICEMEKLSPIQHYPIHVQMLDYILIEDPSCGLIILKVINSIHLPEFFFLLQAFERLCNVRLHAGA